MPLTRLFHCICPSLLLWMRLSLCQYRSLSDCSKKTVSDVISLSLFQTVDKVCFIV